MLRRIEWVPQWPEADDDDLIVWVSIAKADASWRRDDLYVPRGAPDSRGKYDRAGEWILTSPLPIEMPHVSLYRGALSFTDGRHRFAWVRDHGGKAIPLTIWKREAKRLTERFGTPLRVCEIVA